MPINIPQKEYKTYVKPNYFNMEKGKHSIRFLQTLDETAVIPFHWLGLNKPSVQCLGDDCPICKVNRQLQEENVGKKWSEIPGYVSLQQKYAINILDRTMVKVCPKTECQAESKADMNTGKFPTVCAKCGTVIASVIPAQSNKVKILGFSVTLARMLNEQEAGQLDAEGNPKPVTSYDFDLLVIPSGTRKNPTSMPAPERCDTVEVPSEMLFDATQIVMKFSAEEINDILKGTKLSDIFAHRKVEHAVEQEVSEQESVDISEKVNSLLDD